MWAKLTGKKNRSTRAAEILINFQGGGETSQTEFGFGLRGAKTVSSVLWFYFLMAVGLRLTLFPSETLRYGLQAKFQGKRLEKTKIRAETFGLALALPADGRRYPASNPDFSSISGLCLPLPTLSRDIF